MEYHTIIDINIFKFSIYNHVCSVLSVLQEVLNTDRSSDSIGKPFIESEPQRVLSMALGG